MIINRYLLREVGLTFIAVIGVLTAIFLTHRFARYLAESVAGNLTNDVLFILIGFNFLTSLMVLIPISLFFSILLALGRLYKDSEMIVMLACGVSQWQVLKPIAALGVGLAFIVGLLSLYITPWAIGKIETLKWGAKSVSRFTGMQPGQFKSFQSGNRVFYFEKFHDQNGLMLSIILYQGSYQKGMNSNFITARQGRFSTDSNGAVVLFLEDGFQYQGQAGRGDYRITQFQQNAIRLQKQVASPRRLKRRALPLAELWNSNNSRDQAEFQWRLSMPLATIILVLIAVPLSKTTPRQGRFAKLFAAILVYLAYNNLLGIARTWIESKVVPSGIGLWWVHLIALIAALGMLYRANGGRRWVRLSLKRKR